MTTKNHAATGEEVAEKIDMFVSKIGFDKRVSEPRDLEFEDKVSAKIMELGLSASDLDKIRKIHDSCCIYVTLCYRSLDMDIKVYVAAYSVLTLTVDSLFVGSSSMQTFILKLMNGEPQTDPYLACYARLLAVETPKYYGAFGTNVILRSSIDGFTGALLESSLPETNLTVMEGFPKWMRSITSFGTSFAQFLFPIKAFPEDRLEDYVQLLPNIGDMVGYINDIFSFYKERIAASENCFLFYHSKENSCTEIESLNWMCDQVLLLHQNNLKFLDATKSKAVDLYTTFVMGYIEWHYRVGRYKLEEIGLTLTH